LEQAALVLARQEYADLDPAPWLSRIDAIANLARPLLSLEPDAAETIGAVNDVLFRDLQFHGNSSDYNDPRNSFLNDVLERRTGIPISLSVLYMAVARRLGLDLQGTHFPGHFLVLYPRPGWPIVIDAFGGGRILAREDCAQLAARFGLTDLHMALRPAVAIAIVRRMLENLRAIYMAQQDYDRLLRTAMQILVVAPEDVAVRDLVRRLRAGSFLDEPGLS
jgi:regulator of sirC expression with transglutaminase-like and TPR domain